MLRILRYTVTAAALPLFLLVSVAHIPDAQGQSTLSIKGSLKKDGKAFKKGKVLLYERNEIVGKTEPNWRGKFSFELSLNSHYTVEIRSKGHMPKRVSFDTRIPKDVEGADPSRFDFDVIMLEKKRIPEGKEGIFDFPVGRVFFDPYKKEFRFNDSYTSKIRREFRKALDVEMQSMDNGSSDSLITK